MVSIARRKTGCRRNMPSKRLTPRSSTLFLVTVSLGRGAGATVVGGRWEGAIDATFEMSHRKRVCSRVARHQCRPRPWPPTIAILEVTMP